MTELEEMLQKQLESEKREKEQLRLLFKQELMKLSTDLKEQSLLAIETVQTKYKDIILEDIEKKVEKKVDTNIKFMYKQVNQFLAEEQEQEEDGLDILIEHLQKYEDYLQRDEMRENQFLAYSKEIETQLEKLQQILAEEQKRYTNELENTRTEFKQALKSIIEQQNKSNTAIRQELEQQQQQNKMLLSRLEELEIIVKNTIVEN